MTDKKQSFRNIHTIPTGLSFVDCLAQGLWQMSGGLPAQLSAMMILLPNRRACRALQESFLRLVRDDRRSGAMLLPRMQPISEVDEEDLMVLSPAILGQAYSIPPAISPLRRVLMLARQIVALGRDTGDAPRIDQAIQLAKALCSFLDEVETEKTISLDDLDRLVVDELAEHWKITLDFFDILRRHWPAILEEEGIIDPAIRRNLLLDLQARLWQEQPPLYPVIIAGSTGSVPATAELMKVVASLPQGKIVLPGLDFIASDEDWIAIEKDSSHPQYGIAQLLRHLGIMRHDVTLWIGADKSLERFEPGTRSWLIAKALLPATRTHEWNELHHSLVPDKGWNGIERIDCRNEQEEALVIALILREFLESNDSGGAALVTPDRSLAERVAGELRRWSIEIDDSAGRPLSHCGVGVYLLALARAAAQQWAPIPLLALLKHPLCQAGFVASDFSRWLMGFERWVLRGPRPAPGWHGLHTALRRRKGKIPNELWSFLQQGLAILEQKTKELDNWYQEKDPRYLLRSLIEVAERLASSQGADEMDGAKYLYAAEEGEALAEFLGQALDDFAYLPAMDGATFEAMLYHLLSGIDVRPRYGKHPRLFIWGTLEARLQQADLLVLGGLNEGTWPRTQDGDPWMSRPMRKQFGLPDLERKVGLSAHDFQQAMGVYRVVMTRSMRVDGQPTVPSRWVLRLDALRKSLGLEGLVVRSSYQDLARRIDDAGKPHPCKRPEPAPGAEWRPRVLSVTRIETWRRDPYAIYASKILQLNPLDPLDQEPDNADLGSLFHHALHEYLSRTSESRPRDALATLLEIGRETFGELLEQPEIWAFWWPRFEQTAKWFVEMEKEYRPSILRSYTEVRASRKIIDGSLSFELTARADRLDEKKDGTLVIIDYKTGAIPSGAEIELGIAPQLALEAMLAEQGAFENISSGHSVDEIAYWWLKGKQSEIKNPSVNRKKLDVRELIKEVEAGLMALLRHYAKDNATYPAVPDARVAPRYNDYEHLERILEWSSGGEAG